MTSSGRYAYAREILSKKVTKIVFTIKRLLSNIDSSAAETRNKLFDALVKPVLLYGCEIWGPELLSYKTHFDKSTIEQVHIKFCKQTLNVPWYTENKACRAELGRYPLSIDIKASLLCHWQRLEQISDNPLLHEAFIYARNHVSFMIYTNALQKRGNKTSNVLIKNSRFSIKQQLHKKISQDWFKAQNDISDSCKQEYTNKEIKKDYRLEEYLKIVRNPAHRISMTKLRLGAHTLHIQTGKYENKGAFIPVEERLCLVCKRNCIEDEEHFLIDCTEYESLIQQLYFHISENDSTFINLIDHDRTLYLLRLDNEQNLTYYSQICPSNVSKTKTVPESKIQLIR